MHFSVEVMRQVNHVLFNKIFLCMLPGQHKHQVQDVPCDLAILENLCPLDLLVGPIKKTDLSYTMTVKHHNVTGAGLSHQ